MTKYNEVMTLLDEKVGNRDGLIPLSTIALKMESEEGVCPAARIVNARYEGGSFYTVTYATSSKMRQTAENPHVAVCVVVTTFTADGGCVMRKIQR